MLSSLLAQLSSQVDLTPDCLVSLHRTYQHTTPPTDVLKRILQNLFEEVPFFHVHLIIDALDEIPGTEGREEACKLLEELSQSPKAHVLVTSRREHDLPSVCQNATASRTSQSRTRQWTMTYNSTSENN
jgi:pyridoxal/pyridoxine/pyridoxamine kinase